MTTRLIELHDALLTRSGKVFPERVTWSLERGQAWVLTGPNSSGKTTLLETLAGKHRLGSGTLVTHPNLISKYVPFRENSRFFRPTDYYYQQRFEFSEPDDCPTVQEFLANRPHDSLTAILERDVFHIQELLPLKLIKLSNGQMRRVRLARALASNPDLLLLDEPFSGLDQPGRLELDHQLRMIHQLGVTLVMALTRDFPEWITDEFTLLGLTRHRPNMTTPPLQPLPNPRALLEYRDVSVRHGANQILDHITWVVREGERWALTGDNGAGKSTLLSLAFGDHPAAFGNDVRVLGRRRGSGETIWELKEQIGFFSPELHHYYAARISAQAVVGSGFAESQQAILLTPEQKNRVQSLLDDFSLTSRAKVLYPELSTGEQRLVLILRALVKQAPLVVLDEPFQCLDRTTRAHLVEWLKHRLLPSQALILVAHHQEDRTLCTDQELHLAAGRMMMG